MLHCVAYVKKGSLFFTVEMIFFFLKRQAQINLHKFQSRGRQVASQGLDVDTVEDQTKHSIIMKKEKGGNTAVVQRLLWLIISIYVKF